MRRIEPDAVAVTVLTMVLLALGVAGQGMEAAPLRLQIAEQFDSQPSEVLPEGWIREFDSRRERTIERLNGKMEELRRKLERRERPARIRLAATA